MFNKLLQVNFPYLSNGPVDAFSYAHFQQSLGNVSRGVDQGADEVVVVIALEDDLHVPLEQARLCKVVGFHGVIFALVGVRSSLGSQSKIRIKIQKICKKNFFLCLPRARDPYAGHYEFDVVEVRQEENSL